MIFPLKEKKMLEDSIFLNSTYYVLFYFGNTRLLNEY